MSNDDAKKEANVADDAASSQFVKPMDPPPKTLEQQEEAKLRAKYPTLKNAQSNNFLQKRLSKGTKYFDSGDYQMAKQGARGGKGPLGRPQLFQGQPPTGDAIPKPDSIPSRKTSLQTSERSKFATPHLPPHMQNVS